MTIRQQAIHLPAYEIADKLNAALTASDAVVVTAPPGAGKSTLLPLTMLQQTTGRIIVLEPRRLAARQVAERLAANIDEVAGNTVGYTVRFDSRVGADTRIEVVTEGVMMRRLLTDTTLDDVSVVVFDEFHERSLTSDVALALVRDIQQLLRPELRIVIMSATIDTTMICQALDAPLIECLGRMYHVRNILMPRQRDTTDTESISHDVCSVIRMAHHDNDGDILAFLPGQAEIARCLDMLADSLGDDTLLCPLYGLMPPEKQRQAIAPSPQGRRKVVLATSIAETSLTIEGIRVVVDSGFARRMVTDPGTGLSHLETVRISRDMATQRCGRAGRVAQGICYQLWNNAIALNMRPTRMPEITDADLSSAILSIMTWGENDIEALPWLTMPSHASVVKSQQLLCSLGAIASRQQAAACDHYHITAEGKRMAELPCHPRIARMLIKAASNEQKALAADIAALLEERDPLPQAENDADINTRIALLRQMRRRHSLGRWNRVEKVAEQYRRIIHTPEDNGMTDRYDAGSLIAMAYPERIGRQQQNGHYHLSGGDNAVVDAADQLSSYDWIAIASMNAQSGRIFLASPVNPHDLDQTVYDNVSWNSKQQRVMAQREWRAGRLVVTSKPIHDVTTDAVHAILSQAAKKEGLSMFNIDEKMKQLQRRIAAVAEWHPELSLPDVSTQTVMDKADAWIPLFAGRMMSSSELRKIDMCEVIWSFIDYPLRATVERLAPSHIQMPNGHRILIDYRQGAEAPVLSVRLQECFHITGDHVVTMKETPCVDDGRRPLLMELLSPGFKPVQLTKDMRSFWQTTYPEVRKELRRRYPKHAWPETVISDT